MSVYDAAPVMRRVARVTALMTLSFLALTALVVALVLLGWLGVVLFGVGAGLAAVEGIVSKFR